MRRVTNAFFSSKSRWWFLPWLIWITVLKKSFAEWSDDPFWTFFFRKKQRGSLSSIPQKWVLCMTKVTTSASSHHLCVKLHRSCSILRKSHTKQRDDTLPKVSFKCLSIPAFTMPAEAAETKLFHADSVRKCANHMLLFWRKKTSPCVINVNLSGQA